MNGGIHKNRTRHKGNPDKFIFGDLIKELVHFGHHGFLLYRQKQQIEDEQKSKGLELHVVEMAFEENDICAKNKNVFLQIPNLQSISAALKPIEKTYVSMKHSHPIVSSVCGLYEKGVSIAGSWAVWSMQPALHVLEHQLVAVNSMACRGLKHMEEKIPALQGPPAELAASIKKRVSSALEAAKVGIASPIKHTSNTVLCKVSSGYQESKITLTDNIQNILNSKAVCLAEQRVDRALTLTENLIDYILPASAEETEESHIDFGEHEEDDGRVEEQKPDARSSGPKPSLSRLGALASTIYRRASEKIAAQFQPATSQGQGLFTHAPGVTPLSNRVQKLVTGLGQQFQKAYGSVVANVKKALSEDAVTVVLRSFGTARNKKLLNLPHRQPSNLKGGSQPTERDEKDGAEKCLGGSLELQSNGADPMHSPPDNSEDQSSRAREPKEISEETQKEGHEADSYKTESDYLGSNKNIPNHSPSRKGQADHAQMPLVQSQNGAS